MPPLTIALTPSTAAYLSPDGRTYRCDLTTEDDALAAVVHTWTLEFPEHPSARLWLESSLADSATARRFRSEARQSGLRVEAAWPLPESFTLTEPDEALADRLAELRSSILTETHNLLRRPKVELKVNWRRVVGTAAILAAAILAGMALHQRVRRREREVNSSAAAEREAEFAAAGRRRARTLASAQALLSAARRPPPYVASLLRELSAEIPLSAVVDELTVDGSSFRLQLRAVPDAPGASTVGPLLRKSLFPASAPWRLTTPPAENSDPAQPYVFQAIVPVPSTPATANEIQSAADEARAALPPPAAVDTLVRTLAAAWSVHSTATTSRVIPLLCVTLTPRAPSAWPDLLSVATQLDSFPGASIDRLEAKSSKDESGAFETLSVSITFRLRPSIRAIE